MRLITFVGLIVSLGLLPSSAKALPIKRATLVGAWHTDVDNCEGDLTKLYSANGQYGSDNEEGVWSLHGNKLIVTVTKSGEMGEEFTPLHPPQRIVLTIVRVGKRTRIERWNDGSIHRSYRCS